MAKLIICRGIPASGKSYWAAKMKLHGMGSVEVVTRDDIRQEYGCVGEGWSREKEIDFVIPEMESRIIAGLRKGLIVISADTNVNDAVVVRLIYLARQQNAECEIKEFDTPLEVCIERDAQREYPWKVGADKLREYHQKWEKRNAISS